MDDLVRPEEERRLAVVLLLWLQHRHDHLVRDEVGMSTPRRHKELVLIIWII